MNSNLPREPVSRPGEPTDASPGSPRKIRVLMERASRREALFHPGDNLKRRLPERPEEILPEPHLIEEEDEVLEQDEPDELVEIEADLAS